jgi:hypothetical protein
MCHTPHPACSAAEAWGSPAGLLLAEVVGARPAAAAASVLLGTPVISHRHPAAPAAPFAPAAAVVLPRLLVQVVAWQHPQVHQQQQQQQEQPPVEQEEVRQQQQQHPPYPP